MGAATSHPTNTQLVDALEVGQYEGFLAAVAENRKFAKRPLRSRNGDTGIHILATKGHAQALNTVCKAVLNAYARERGGTLTPEQQKKCAAKVSNVLNDRGRTPIMAAAKHGHIEAVRVLLAYEANIWTRDQEGGAILTHYAAAAGHVDVIKLLYQHALTHPPPSSLEGKSIIDIPNANGLTPLHYAVWHKRHQVVSALCEMGASLYSASTCSTCGDETPLPAGSTPMHFVAVSGSLRCSKALMRAYVALLSSHEDAVREGRVSPEDMPVDPRVLADIKGDLPCTVASKRNNLRLLCCLHPLVGLDELFADERPENRLVGVPKLTEMCCMVAQRLLLQQLEQLQPPPAPPSTSTTGPTAGTPEKASAAITSPAAAAAATLPTTLPNSPPPSTPPRPVVPATATSPVPGSQQGHHGAPVGSPVPNQQPQPPQPPGPGGRTVFAALIQQETDYSDVAARDSSGDELGLQQPPTTTATSTAENGLGMPDGAQPTTANGGVAESQIAPRRSNSSHHIATAGNMESLNVPASSLEALNLILAAKASSNQQSWIERRGAWRSKLPPLPRLKTAGNRPDVAPPRAQNGTLVAVGAVGCQGGVGQGGANPWMSRRSAWRATLKRHEQQLLEGASAATRALQQGHHGHVKSHFASTQNLAELRSLLASQPPDEVVPAPHPHDHHIPPGAALCLRLLGVGGDSSGPGAEGEAGSGGGDGVGGAGGRAGVALSRDQIDAAIHMVRMHRLRNGVNDFFGGMGIEPIYEAAHDDHTCGPTEAHGTHLPTPNNHLNDHQLLGNRTSRELCNGVPGGLDTPGVLVLRSTSPKPTLDPLQGNSPAALPDAAATNRSLFSSIGRLSFNRLPGSKAPSLSGRASSMCDDDTCGVCLESGTMLSIKNCSHALCLSCARELVKLHDLKPSLCPFCRSLIMGFAPQVITSRT